MSTPDYYTLPKINRQQEFDVAVVDPSSEQEQEAVSEPETVIENTPEAEVEPAESTKTEESVAEPETTDDKPQEVQ